MELLPTEFIDFAKHAKVSDKTIQSIISAELMNMKFNEDQMDMNWREVPIREDIQPENWSILEHPNKIFLLKNIVRRQVFQNNQMFCNSDLSTISLVDITKEKSIKFQGFRSKEEFLAKLTGNYSAIQSVDQEFKSIESLSSDEFFVLTALIELFLTKYPYPDTNWIPDELLIFTSKSLQLIIKESNEKIEDQTWWQHWNRISKQNIPNKEDLETAIFMLATKSLIGVMEEVESEDVYFIGKNLVWLIRSIVWWDKGFIIENKMNNTTLYLFQASSLFILINEGDNNFNLFNIDGTDLQKIILNFLSLTDEQPENRGPDDEIQNYEDSDYKVPEIGMAKKIPNFCSNCGSSLKKEANFCTNCGSKINYLDADPASTV